MPVLGSQPAGDVSHKPGGRLPLLSARPAATEPPWGSEGEGEMSRSRAGRAVWSVDGCGCLVAARSERCGGVVVL